ncbi:hypothetical protein RF074_14575 [Serratia marcescens]|nr:hypothetical protein [Serratia marcescens]
MTFASEEFSKKVKLTEPDEPMALFAVEDRSLAERFTILEAETLS